MLETGIEGKQSITVSEGLTAKAMGSGELAVYATPAMIALMESTAMLSVKPYLETGQGTVGIRLDVKHTSATPLGMQVSCESRLIEIDGKRLVFEVKAMDAQGPIGAGIHERFIIDEKRFMSKAEQKKAG